MRQFILLSCVAIALGTPVFSSTNSQIVIGSGNLGYEGGKANTPLIFDVQAYDSSPSGGQPYTSSVFNLTFEITVRDLDGNPPFRPPSSVVDHGNGVYTITYEVATPGTWRLMTKGSTTGVYTTNVNGGALLIEITESATALSTASGPGVTGNTRNEQQLIPFTIQARGADGSPLTTGGDTFVVHAFTYRSFILGRLCHYVQGILPQFCAALRYETTPHATVTDNNDGTYTAQYWIARYGDYQVQVTIDGQNIAGAPFDVRWKNVPGI